jgi:hypothetical protein
MASGFADLVPGTTPTGNVRAYDLNLRPQFTHQWNVFAEYRLSEGMSAQVGYVGNRANHLVAPVEGNQALPGVGDPSTWAPKATRRPLYGSQPLITTIATTASLARSEYNSIQASVRQREWHGAEFMASYTFAKAYTNNRGYYGGGGVVASEGAYWANTYDSDAEWGPAFHDVRHNFVFSGTYELPSVTAASGARSGAASRTRSSAAGSSAASSRRAPASRSRSSTVAPARCRVSAASSGRTASATRSRPTRA